MKSSTLREYVRVKGELFRNNVRRDPALFRRDPRGEDST